MKDRTAIQNLAQGVESIYHNAQVKVYPDGSAAVLCLERPLIRAAGWEEQGREKREPKDKPEAERKADSLARAQRRARAAVFDLAMSTPFTLFVTLTVDGSKLDRYDPEDVFHHLHDWLDNRVRRNGLTYVLIPEYHKDGAIHFHALMTDALPLADSGTIIPPEGGKPRRPRSAAQRASWLTAGGSIVYNLPAWSWGFSTAIRLHGDRRAAVGYVSKYITKSEAKIGGRWYYSGGDLKRPDKFTADLDFQKVSSATDRGVFQISDLGCMAAKMNIGGNIDEALAQLV